MVIFVTIAALGKFRENEDCALYHVKNKGRVKLMGFSLNRPVFHRAETEGAMSIVVLFTHNASSCLAPWWQKCKTM